MVLFGRVSKAGRECLGVLAHGVDLIADAAVDHFEPDVLGLQGFELQHLDPE